MVTEFQMKILLRSLIYISSYYGKCYTARFLISYHLKIIINALNLRILLFLFNFILLKYLCHNECFTTSAFVKQRHLWIYPIYMKRMHKKVIIRKIKLILLNKINLNFINLINLLYLNC